MFKIFSVFILLLMVSSCHTTYYYARFDTNNPYLDKDYTRNFIDNGDSIAISYSFSGENAPLKIAVYNKMSRSLFVDWESSFFYFGDGFNNGMRLGDYISDYKVLEIKPLQNKQRIFFELEGLHFDKLNKRAFKKQQIKLSEKIDEKFKVASFNEETTPLYLKSHLTLYIGSDRENPIPYEHDFYIGSVIDAGEISPTKVEAVNHKSGDVFYTRKEHGKGLKNALRIGGEVLLITGAIAVEVILATETE